MCDDAEIRCQQTEDMLLSEKRRMEGMMSLKSQFEAQILEVMRFSNLQSLVVNQLYIGYDPQPSMKYLLAAAKESRKE